MAEYYESYTDRARIKKSKRDVFILLICFFTFQVNFAFSMKEKEEDFQEKIPALLRLSTNNENNASLSSSSTRISISEIEEKIKNYGQLEQECKVFLIKEAISYIDSVHLDLKEKFGKVTLFLGKTTSGKSTLIHYLAGSKIKGHQDENDDYYLIIKPAPGLENIEIGNNISSCTSKPTPIPHRAIGSTLFDCPGLGDSRGVVQQIVNANLIHEVMKKSTEMNFVLTIKEEALTGDNISSALRPSIAALQSYIPEINKLKDCVLLVVTKGKRSRKAENDAASFIKQVDKILEDKNVELHPDHKSFLQVIKSERKFEFSFKDETPHKVRVDLEAKGRIIENLKNLGTIKTIEMKNNITNVISSESKNMVSIFSESINEYIKENLENLGKIVRDYYSAQTKTGNLSNSSICHLQRTLSDFCRRLDNFEATPDIVAFYNKLNSLIEDSRVEPKVNLDVILLEIRQQERALALFQTIDPRLRSVYDTNAWLAGLRNVRGKIQKPLRFLNTRKAEIYRALRRDEYKQRGGNYGNDGGGVVGALSGGLSGAIVGIIAGPKGVGAGVGIGSVSGALFGKVKGREVGEKLGEAVANTVEYLEDLTLRNYATNNPENTIA